MQRIATAPTLLLRKVPLWPRLVVAVSVVFLVLLAVVGALTTRAADESRDRILQERLVIAEMAGSQVDGIFEHAFSELERAATSNSLPSGGTDALDISAKLQRVLDGLSDIWFGLSLVDADGQPIASVPVSQPRPSVITPGEVATRDALASGRGVSVNPRLPESLPSFHRVKLGARPSFRTRRPPVRRESLGVPAPSRMTLPPH